MDSLQASYRDDEDEAQAQLDLTKQQPEPVLVVNSRNEAAQESESQLNSVAPEPPKPSSPKGDVGKEPESLNGHTHEDRDEPKVEPMETDCCVSKSAAQEPSSITEDAATQESEPRNDTVQAQREHTEPDSISERAVQEQDSVNDAAPEAQREFVVSDSISSDDAALESEPQNDGGAQEARPQAMVTDPVSDKDAETPLEAHTSTQPETMASESFSEDDPTASDDTQKSSKLVNTAAQNDDLEEEEDEDGDRPPKKQRPLSLLTNLHEQQPHEQEKQIPVANNNSTAKAITKPSTGTATKKSKKKSFSVWVSRTTRKGKKKNKTNAQKEVSPEDTVLITPVPRFPDKGDDNPEMKICLSKVYKAEKVELSEDRLTAGSTKGYRMVRATRGVVEGAWYYEIKVVALGATGHTRLGWSTEKGDLQAPVGYDGNSYGYRDIDGSKVHKALREKYGEEGYKEGDVIGFYINLPDGGQYAPKPPHYVWYKGQRYVCAPDAKEDQPKVIPGSEISFYKNGVCQGVAFKDLNGGRYHAAASMYTLPNQPNCVVKFNFGPGFECFPEDFGARPAPSPMIEVPYHGVDSRNENGESNEKNQ